MIVLEEPTEFLQRRAAVTQTGSTSSTLRTRHFILITDQHLINIFWGGSLRVDEHPELWLDGRLLVVCWLKFCSGSVDDQCLQQCCEYRLLIDLQDHCGRGLQFHVHNRKTFLFKVELSNSSLWPDIHSTCCTRVHSKSHYVWRRRDGSCDSVLCRLLVQSERPSSHLCSGLSPVCPLAAVCLLIAAPTDAFVQFVRMWRRFFL